MLLKGPGAEGAANAGSVRHSPVIRGTRARVAPRQRRHRAARAGVEGLILPLCKANVVEAVGRGENARSISIIGRP